MRAGCTNGYLPAYEYRSVLVQRVHRFMVTSSQFHRRGLRVSDAASLATLRRQAVGQQEVSTPMQIRHATARPVGALPPGPGWRFRLRWSWRLRGRGGC